MKKLTKKQRREIYLKAFKVCYNKNRNWNFLCGILSELSAIPATKSEYGQADFSNMIKSLPEFEMFKQDSGIWFWGALDIIMMERATVMLLCAEMCNQ